MVVKNVKFKRINVLLVLFFIYSSITDLALAKYIDDQTVIVKSIPKIKCDENAIYVSHSGSSNGSGTLANPFNRVEKAKNYLRKIRNTVNNSKDPISVCIREGVYDETSLQFTSEDSGLKNVPIIYGAYHNEKVTLSGGIGLNPSWFNYLQENDPLWERFDSQSRKLIRVVDLKKYHIFNYGKLEHRGLKYKNKKNKMEVSVNGSILNLSRWPNKYNDVNLKKSYNSEEKKWRNDNELIGYDKIKNKISDLAFTINSNRHERWFLDHDIWITGLFGNYWSDDTLPVKIVDNTVTFNRKLSYGIKENMPYFMFNIPEELDSEDEYYLDENSGHLYIYGDTPLSLVQISMLRSPVITGANFSNIIFENFTVDMSRSDLVNVDGVENVIFNNLILRNTGETAIKVNGINNVISHSTIYGSGSGGVSISGGDRKTLSSSNNIVIDNDIYNYGRLDRTYKPGVYVSGVGNIVRNNYIHDAPHSGIIFSGNNNLFELNIINNVVTDSNDAGAIYTGRDWGYRGNVIRYNLIKNINSIFGRSHGVYLDDGVSGIHVYGNIFLNINGFAILSGGGRDNIMVDNIIYNAKSGALHTDRRVKEKFNNLKLSNKKSNGWNLLARLNVDYTKGMKSRYYKLNYKLEPWRSAYPNLEKIPNDYDKIVKDKHWLEPEGCVFNGNVIWKTKDFIVNGRWGGKEASNFYLSTSPNYKIDPILIDNGEINYGLNFSLSSPIFKIEKFPVIPFDNIGIR
jgi:hypothetical protein